MVTREEAIMANDSQKDPKIKTPFARMIVGGNQEKPYFSILYFDPIDRDFYVGYSSYCLDYVSNWLNEEFEIAEDENFIIAALRPVSREQVEKEWMGYWIHEEIQSNQSTTGYFKISSCECSKCGCHVQQEANFCPNCGAPMTDEAVDMMLKRLEEIYK